MQVDKIRLDTGQRKLSSRLYNHLINIFQVERNYFEKLH